MSFITTWKNSWKDSLALFNANQRQMVLLVTLKTILTAYTKLLFSLWWLVLLYGAALYFCYTSLPWVPAMVGLFLVSLMFLAIRPSVERKTFSYFVRYLAHDYEMLFILFLMPYLILSGFVAHWYTLFFVFLMFFVADSGALWGSKEGYGLLKALYRAVIMVLSNAPLLFIVHGFFILMFILLHNLLGIPLVLLVGLAPIPLSFFNTIYVKRVHEQLNLYV